ncbi:hypothetical protein EXIGLDRAFT_744237 [Exidia glandulosa HHB12029]|uniref:F-box domain-containing protein n=1 Tax=Exidia glandulosa HHB12029 TaxID=1314781 RepID=A0A165Q407_EXIGL|nr:hypothetical protein EXIGLDRAFT_744237 [Exidia glandulosa HHB12029]
MSSPTFTAHSDHLAFYAGLAAEGVLNSVTRCEDAAGALAEPLRIFRCAVALAAQKWNEEHSQIRRLPIEILAYCFSFFDSIIDKVTVASRVCSHWRSVALHSPPLWFEIDLLRGVHGAQAKILHALPALLERSKGQPVSLVACVTTTSDVATLAHCLEDHLTHIRHLDISDNSTTTNNIGFTGFWTPAPILESLKYDGAIAIHGSLFSGFCPLLHYPLQRRGLNTTLIASQHYYTCYRNCRAWWFVDSAILNFSPSRLCRIRYDVSKAWLSHRTTATARLFYDSATCCSRKAGPSMPSP